MPLALQAKLLRALQEGEIEPLGSNKLIPFDARVIAATSRDLVKLVREGSFREDLYYRLNVLPIRVPPLRERSEDLAALVEALGEDMALRSGEQPPELSPEALALLARQPWRGNIRELRNVLEQAAMRADSHFLGREQIEAVLRETAGCAHRPGGRRVPAGTEAGRRFGRAGVAQPVAPRWTSRWPNLSGRRSPPRWTGAPATRWRWPGCWAYRAPSCTNACAPRMRRAPESIGTA
jgi:DNA-binding NtrC family response regulator